MKLSSPRILHTNPPTPSFLQTRTLSTLQNRLPASYYRGGTSRAVIFQRKDLPPSPTTWPHIFRSVLGSPDPNGRQLDGLGGGISSLSKVCVIGPSERDDADVDYTFAAVGVRDEEVDFSSNCGNMTAAVGPFAVDNGIVDVNLRGNENREENVTVRIHNTNTGKIIHSTFPVVKHGEVVEAAASGDFAIDGVSGTAAAIELAFIDPAGSKTGKMLPTGNVTDKFDGIETTCIDVGNPCVFIHAKDIGVEGTILPDEIDAHPTLLSRLDSIRRKASVAMGISVDETSTPGSIPKIALVSQPQTHSLLSGETIQPTSVDLVIRALSVGQPHRAVPITVALALASAASIEGSVVESLVKGRRVDERGITLGHPSGKTVVNARFDGERGLMDASVMRTSRRLMDGWVYWK